MSRHVNLEAERAALGSILISPHEALGAVAQHVDDTSWSDGRHRRVWQAMRALKRSGQAIDVVTIRSELGEGSGVPLAYITGLAESVPTAANAAHYGKTVAEKAHARRLLGALRTATKQVDDDPSQAETAVSSILAAIARSSGGARLTSLAAEIDSLFNRLAAGDEPSSIPTGLRAFDVGGGLLGGQLIVIASRPGVGKSALAMNIAMCAAERERVVFVSGEMSPYELAMRVSGALGDINTQRFLRPAAMKDHWEKFAAARRKAEPLDVDILESRGEDGLALSARVEAEHSIRPIRLVIFDYLQLFARGGGRFATRESQVASLVYELKYLAGRLACPVIVLSQFNRDLEKEGREPRNSDLRESGAIEQAADQIGLLHREVSRETGGLSADTKLIVSKRRGGRVGTFHLRFTPEFQRFEDAKGFRA